MERMRRFLLRGGFFGGVGSLLCGGRFVGVLGEKLCRRTGNRSRQQGHGPHLQCRFRHSNYWFRMSNRTAQCYQIAAGKQARFVRIQPRRSLGSRTGVRPVRMSAGPTRTPAPVPERRLFYQFPSVSNAVTFLARSSASNGIPWRSELVKSDVTRMMVRPTTGWLSTSLPVLRSCAVTCTRSTRR